MKFWQIDQKVRKYTLLLNQLESCLLGNISSSYNIKIKKQNKTKCCFLFIGGITDIWILGFKKSFSIKHIKSVQEKIEIFQ